jgi:hypothetical protein
MNHQQRSNRSARRALLCLAIGWLSLLIVGSSGASAAWQIPSAPVAKSKSDKELRVLFVGNSYCYVNDMPQLLSDLAKSKPNGVQIAVQSVTPGGATIKQHFESTGALKTIRAGGFTHVVLQAQSLEPLSHPELFQTFARKLALEVEESKATAVFFQTWARKAGAAEYQQAWSGGTPARMQAGLSDAYAKAAADSPAQVARVGDAWRALLDQKDPLELFSEDGSHPSLAGSYLAACVFYERLTGESCVELDAKREGLSAADAKRLRQLAHERAAK